MTTTAINPRLRRYVTEREYVETLRRCQNEWSRQSAPFIRQMIDLRMLFCWPLIFVQDGHEAEFRDSWKNTDAKAQHDEVEKILEIMQADIFAPMQLISINPNL